MTFLDTILVALFCILVVFAVLGLLWIIIRLFSLAIIAFEKRMLSATKGNKLGS